MSKESKSKGIATRAERRGRSVTVWNETLKKFDHYRLSSRGKWIAVYPYSNTDKPNAEPLSKRQMMLLNN
tara:strand:+ start:3832 stop:4041 length:210 start_codon:yes stop_codon:yes gene_type:complete